jgi:hypothetical protein
MTDTISSERLDRLRAGLYEDQAEQREQLQEASAGIPGDLWAPVLAEMDALAEASAAVTNQLRLRRRQVLSGEYRGRSGQLPRLALAACAGVALVVAVTVMRQPTEPVDLAGSPAPAGARLEVPDLADNVDFYHWMENRAVVATEPKGT